MFHIYIIDISQFFQNYYIYRTKLKKYCLKIFIISETDRICDNLLEIQE